MSVEPKVEKIFGLIKSFVSDLTEVFGTKQHSLLLYNHLLSKTNVKDSDAVTKHVETFNKFVEENQTAILERDFKKFTNPVILYSKKIKIQLDEIFKLSSDKDTVLSIWKHLLLITSTIDPSTDAMSVLKKSLEEKSTEGEFLNNIFDKIKDNVDENNEDPMSAIMGLMSSGVVPELVSSMTNGMQNGSLDMSKLFSTVQSMMTSMGGAGGSGMEGMFSGMQNMMSHAQNQQSEQSSSSSVQTISEDDVEDETENDDGVNDLD